MKKSFLLIATLSLAFSSQSQSQDQDSYLMERVNECAANTDQKAASDCVIYWSTIATRAKNNVTTIQAEHEKHKGDIAKYVESAKFLVDEKTKCEQSANKKTCLEYWSNIEAQATASGKSIQDQHAEHLSAVGTLTSNDLYLAQERAKCADSSDRATCEQFWTNIQTTAKASGITNEQAYKNHLEAVK